MNPMDGGWAIMLTLLVAMVLSIAHLPEVIPGWVAWLRPHWFVMALFYWVVAHPERVGLILSWAWGFLLDALLAEPLGLNGLCFAGVTYVAWSLHARLRMFGFAQQALFVLGLCFAVELVKGTVGELTGTHELRFALVVAPVVTALLWPFVALLLEGIDRRVPVR